MRKLATPSPALVISMVALFVALGGTGYAASQAGAAITPPRPRRTASSTASEGHAGCAA